MCGEPKPIKMKAWVALQLRKGYQPFTLDGIRKVIEIAHENNKKIECLVFGELEYAYLKWIFRELTRIFPKDFDGIKMKEDKTVFGWYVKVE